MSDTMLWTDDPMAQVKAQLEIMTAEKDYHEAIANALAVAQREDLSDYKKLKLENEQLKARVVELEEAIQDFCDKEAGRQAVRFKITFRELLTNTPTQSLAARDARVTVEALRELSIFLFDDFDASDRCSLGTIGLAITAVADRIEKEANPQKPC